MGKILVRYKVKPERADENVRLVKAVYAELAEKKPEGFRYATLVADDGLTFFHLASVEGEESPVVKLDAFKAFQANIKERCDEPPAPVKLTKIGAYNFFPE